MAFAPQPLSLGGEQFDRSCEIRNRLLEFAQADMLFAEEEISRRIALIQLERVLNFIQGRCVILLGMKRRGAD